MCDDDWVNLAISDDSLVVDLLLRLRQPPPPPPPSPCLRLHWTVRQRRSRSASKHKDEPTTASPTTPLSWSPATSPSATAAAAAGGGDGSEDSTKPLKTSRSKVANPSETTTTKKAKRKKTLAELKEEESVLLKEQRNLKSELATLRLTLEEHRATNERLKRLKLDFESRQHLKSDTIPVADKAMADLQPHSSVSLTTTSSIPRIVVDNASHVPPENGSCKHLEIDKQEASFVLPDLNLPVDEDLSPISTHGLSQ